MRSFSASLAGRPWIWSVLAILLAVIYLFPVYWMIATSLK